MDKRIHSYLSIIGQRGGRASTRHLDTGTARDMVRLREARRAFRLFFTRCFWSCDPAFVVTARDIAWVAEQLMKYGGREGWERGARLCH
jgi:hypothetical protein